MKKLIGITVIFMVLVVLFYVFRVYFREDSHVVRINNFSMTLDEFENYFAKMNAERPDTLDSRQGVLEALISKKLILQEAEKLSLHKSEEFLGALQHYYEQLLFKLIVDLKSKELASEVNISDSQVRDRYDEMLEEGLTDKRLDEIYQQVKWQLLRGEQTRALNDWLDEVKECSAIEIDYDMVLNKEGGVE